MRLGPTMDQARCEMEVELFLPPALGHQITRVHKQPSAEAPQSARPPWWVDLPRFQVPKYAALESKKRAHKLLRELEDSKIAGGQDFGLLGLINLQRVCREGNVDLSNRFGAVATRDSMLRVAIQEVIKQVAASGGGSERAGGLTMPPREFVCGLSVSIGVPEPRTVTIVHAAIAADARARLLQIAAALRTGRPEQAAAEMAALRAILTSFPMPDSAPEAELVGAGLRDKFTTSEMESVLKEMAFEMPSQMSLFVVLLGFDREVTVPYLEQYVADRKAGKV